MIKNTKPGAVNGYFFQERLFAIGTLLNQEGGQSGYGSWKKSDKIQLPGDKYPVRCMDSDIVLAINDRDCGLPVSAIRDSYFAGNRFSAGRFESHPFDSFRLDAESGAATDMVERKVESAASRNRRKEFVRKSVFCGHLTLR